MIRLIRPAIALSLLCAATAGAQVSGPPVAPEPRMQSTYYVPLYGVTAGISIPAGKLSEDRAAGYGVGALIEYAVSGQPYSLRGEVMFQRFPLKGGRVGRDVNLFSLGSTIIYRLQDSRGADVRAAGGPYAAGGIAIYNASGEGTRPGLNAGGGVEIPLTGFSAVAEARLHWVLTDSRAMLAVPLTVSVRF